MASIQEIMAYLQQGTRNKIVFCKDDIAGIHFINVGKELSILLGERPETISGFETMYKQVLNQSYHSDSIGMYLAIENIGILFEPELKLDLHSVFNTYSRNQCLIIKTESKIENGILYFLNDTDNVRINLQGMTFHQL